MIICLASTISPEAANGVSTFNNHFIDLFSTDNHVILLYIDIQIEENSPDLFEEINPNYSKVILRQSYLKHLHKLKGYFRPGGSKAAQYISAGLAMREWLFKNHKKYNIDIIEISDGSGMGIFLTDKDLPPLIITGHGSMLQISRYDHTAFDEQGKVIKELERLSYEHSDAIITHSPLNKRDIQLFTDNKIYVSPIAFIYSQSSKKYNAGNYALAAGKLRYFKGPKLLCQALIENKETIVYWIGDDTFDFYEHKNESDYLRERFPMVFEKNFLWLNGKPKADLLKAIKEASFVIIPSIWETFSYIALEAASLGKPIIITNSTGSSYLFENLKSALIVEPEVIQLQQAIARLHASESLRIQLGSNAFKMVEEQFSPSNIIQQRIKVYQEVIAHRKIHKTTFEQNTDFLKKYFNPTRKLYFLLRARVKKLIKKT